MSSGVKECVKVHRHQALAGGEDIKGRKMVRGFAWLGSKPGGGLARQL
jgi:hypothetical protein